MCSNNIIKVVITQNSVSVKSNIYSQWTAFGNTGEHGQAAAKVALAAKRFVSGNVITQLQIMVENHVLVLKRTMVLAMNSLVQVTKCVCLLIKLLPLNTLYFI